MDHILCLILGGGQGTRLYPLTKHRSKPAVPLAGKYRIIDIPISNCINSNIRKMFVITQFNSKSLNHHVNHSYRFDFYGHRFVDILAAQQTMESASWFQGTADAVRRNLKTLIDYHDCDTILILSGDQLYRMDFRELYKRHLDSEFDVTIAGIPVTRDKVSGFGIMKVNSIDDKLRITDFVEKPKDSKTISEFATSKEDLAELGFHDIRKKHIASMGIYMFKKDALVRELERDSSPDFGKDIIPRIIKERPVNPYLYEGYWEDIGTIRSFHQANLDLLGENPKFMVYKPGAPIYTNPRFLPPAFVDGADLDRAIIADGAIVKGGHIHNSVVGLRSVIQTNVTLYNAVLLGADYYDDHKTLSSDEVPLGIGEDSIIRNAIIDKNVRIGKRVRLENTRNIQEYTPPEGKGVYIRDGLIVVEKNTTIKDGTVL